MAPGESLRLSEYVDVVSRSYRNMQTSIECCARAEAYLQINDSIEPVLLREVSGNVFREVFPPGRRGEPV